MSGSRDIEVLMDDGSWAKGRAEHPGKGDSQSVGGDGWTFVSLCVDVDWWASPDEWRELRVPGEDSEQ